MSDEILQKVIEIVSTVLAENIRASGATITADSTMELMSEWDSLNFINIFLAVNEVFDIEADPDDAFHYGSISGIVEFVQKSLGEG
jgi:acyl carrier protein